MVMQDNDNDHKEYIRVSLTVPQVRRNSCKHKKMSSPKTKN